MRIGKYLFLAVAFPPYFVVYGLPKWILVEGIPSIVSMFVWMWKKVQNPVQKQLESRSQKIGEIVGFIQKLGQLLIQPLVHVAVEIREHTQNARACSSIF